MLGTDVGAKADFTSLNFPEVRDPYLRWDGKYPAKWPAWVVIPRNAYFGTDYSPTGSLRPIGEPKHHFFVLCFIKATPDQVFAAYEAAIPKDFVLDRNKTLEPRKPGDVTAITHSYKRKDGKVFVVQTQSRTDYAGWIRLGLNVPGE